jgi:hypothetical protein
MTSNYPFPDSEPPLSNCWKLDPCNEESLKFLISDSDLDIPYPHPNTLPDLVNAMVCESPQTMSTDYS